MTVTGKLLHSRDQALGHSNHLYSKSPTTSGLTVDLKSGSSQVNEKHTVILGTTDRNEGCVNQADEDDDDRSDLTTCGDASNVRSEYGRSVKEIPKCMWNLISNPVYIVTCLGSCMELCIVSGFLVFLPKYLETQFTISKSEANLFAGGIAVPGACFGIFLGGFLLKKFQLGIKGTSAGNLDIFFC